MSTSDENNTLRQILIGVLILMTAGAVMGATGWNFTQVSKIPDNYMKKVDIQHFMERNREDHIAIEHKLDRLLELIMEHKSFDVPRSSSITYQQEDK